MRLVKREAGANPARTRHRDSQATAYYHWETGKGAEASERSVGRPAFRSTGMKIHATRNWQYEICKIRNTSGFILLRSEIRNYSFALWSLPNNSICIFRSSSLFSTASERKFPVSPIYRHIHTLLGQNFLSSDIGLPDARRFCNPNPFPRRNL